MDLELLLWIASGLAAAVGAALVLRRRLASPPAPPPRRDDPRLGRSAVAAEQIKPGFLGKVELDGERWNARVMGSKGLPRGARCKVAKVEGLTLFVKPE